MMRRAQEMRQHGSKHWIRYGLVYPVAWRIVAVLLFPFMAAGHAVVAVALAMWGGWLWAQLTAHVVMECLHLAPMGSFAGLDHPYDWDGEPRPAAQDGGTG